MFLLPLRVGEQEGLGVRRRHTSWVLVAHARYPSYSGGRDRKIEVQRQPRQIVHETLSWKNPSQKRLVEWLKV
jgi:hypothetical protein